MLQSEFSFRVDDTETGQRMDAWVASRIPECSRSFAAALIRDGLIRIGNEQKKPAYRLKPGDQVIGRIPPAERISCLAEPIDLTIVHEDEDILLLNKPAGMVVHPAPGHFSGTLVNALLAHCPDLMTISGELRPGIVHRLDKDTTGLLVVAKTGAALAGLAAQFKNRIVQKDYLALVHGEMDRPSGSVSLPIGRHPADRKKMAVVPSGRPAETNWSLGRHLIETSLLRVRIKTGRTHQIRVHCAAIRHPVVGDPVYGSGSAVTNHSARIMTLLAPIRRQMLHAWRIAFYHPRTGVPLSFEAPLPEDMASVIDLLRP